MKIKATKVIKKNSELNDFHEDGSLGIILGELKSLEPMEAFLYIILYDEGEQVPVFTINHKIEILEEIEVDLSSELVLHLEHLRKHFSPLLKIVV